MTLSNVIEYYKSHQFYYTHFWSPTSLHYGLWYPGTRSLGDAITNADALVVQELRIRNNDRVLDAGCGVGGTSIYIAQEAGCEVAGITISPQQLKIAKQLATKSGVTPLLDFALMDYCHTTFDAGSFSAVVAIESVCHAERKSDFVREAARLLKPGGRIAVMDYFISPRELAADDERLLASWMKGWAIPNLFSVGEFTEALAGAGFDEIRFIDLLHLIWPSVARIYRLGLLAWPLGFMRSVLQRGSESVSCRYQRRIFREKIATYGMFVATKTGPSPAASGDATSFTTSEVAE